MLTDYIHAAMRHAEYEEMADGSWYGHILGLDGVWADAATRESCQSELQSALEDWIVFRLTNRFAIPPIDGIAVAATLVA